MTGSEPAHAAGSASSIEPLRKSVHLALGFGALGLRWVGPWGVAACVLAGLALERFVVHRVTRGRLLRPAERSRGHSSGATAYGLAVLLVVVAFHRRLELAAAIWGLLAFGDGMAAIAGRSVGGPTLPWNSRKSWIGLLAFVSWGTCAAALLIRWTQQAIHDGGGHAMRHVGTSFLHLGEADAVVSAGAVLLVGCLVAAAAAGIAESVDSPLDDNLRVALVGAPVLYAATLVQPSRLFGAADGLVENLALGSVLNVALAAVAWALGGVDRRGALAGAALGTALFTFSGWRGFLLLCGLFAICSVATRVGSRRKEQAGIAEGRGGRRGASQALANAGAAVAFAVLSPLSAHGAWLDLALVAALATATADTAASEIGKAFGGRPWHPIALVRVPRGTRGGISLVGVAAGGLAGAMISAMAWGVGIVDGPGFLAAALGALVGSTVESLLGAHPATASRLGHDASNAINTLVGAAAACLTLLAIRG